MATPPRKLNLTRAQLQAFIGDDFETIKQFERLFAVGDAAQNDTAALQELAELAATEPPGAPDTETPSLSVIDWARFAAYVPTRGRLGWNPFCDTLGLGIGDRGVMVRIGLDTLCCVANNSGSTIAKGAVVRITGATGSGVPNVAPFTANGTQAGLGIVGLMSQELPTGQEGYATVYGIVSGLDTSAFSAGALLYASSTTAGGVTATAPAAPNVAAPVGIVLLVSSTEGQILARCDNSFALRLAAVSSPTGGVMVDVQARTAIDAIIARLQQAGIIA